MTRGHHKGQLKKKLLLWNEQREVPSRDLQFEEGVINSERNFLSVKLDFLLKTLFCVSTKLSLENMHKNLTELRLHYNIDGPYILHVFSKEILFEIGILTQRPGQWFPNYFEKSPFSIVL